MVDHFEFKYNDSLCDVCIHCEKDDTIFPCSECEIGSPNLCECILFQEALDDGFFVKKEEGLYFISQKFLKDDDYIMFSYCMWCGGVLP